MRVLQLIDSLGPGGAERSLAALAPRLVASGVDLDVGHLRPDRFVAPDLEQAGVGIHDLAGGGGRRGSVDRVRVLVRDRRPDLVHTTLFEADVAGRVAARRERVPVVSSLVNVPYGPEHLATPGLRVSRVRAAQAVDILTARFVVRFHAITGTVADTMSRRLRVPRDRIDVIPRGRDSEVLGRRGPERAARIRAGLDVAPDAPLVVAAARHEHQKGLDVLLDAFPAVLAAVPGARLVIAGRDGGAGAALRERAGAPDVAGAVRLLGLRDDVEELLAAADAFVLPSRWEGLGSVLLEAMALEAPIVASDLPAVREVLPGPDVATLVPPERPDALAAAIVATLTDPAAAAARASRARVRFLTHYDAAPVAAAMVAFYDRALASGGG